jgi:EmrB/QacA subfamily drug resistance transporter
MAPNDSATATGTTDGRAAVPGYGNDGHPRRWLVLAVLSAVAFMAQLDLFIVNIAIPAMSHSFGSAGLSGLSWVLNAYAIVFAALLVPAGRLADQFGRRRFLLAGTAIFVLASVCCAVAPDLGILVAGRAVQAAGAALIVPTSLGLLLPAFPQRQHTLVVGIWAGVAAVAGSSGPPVGGLLVAVNWRLIFLINVPIGIATLIGGTLVLPEIRASRGTRLPDPVSAVSLLAAVTLLVYATIQGTAWGWTSPGVLGVLAGAALATVATVTRTLRHPNALIEASLFRSREFTGAALALLLIFIGFAAFLLSTVLFLTDTWHYSALRAGLAIAPGPLAAAVFAVNAGRISARLGRSVQAATGAGLIAAGAAFWLTRAPAHPAYVAGFLPGLIIAGAGAGLAQAPLFAAASTLPPHRATTASAVLNMSRQVGSAIGVAILVALLGSSRPTVLPAFHRGWTLIVIVGVCAALAALGSRGAPDRRRHRRSLLHRLLGRHPVTECLLPRVGWRCGGGHQGHRGGGQPGLGVIPRPVAVTGERAPGV